MVENKVVKQVIGNATLYCGDAYDVIQMLADQNDKPHVVITDPPWGLGDLSGTISKQRNKNAYQGYKDTEENLANYIIPICGMAVGFAGRALVTPGAKCMYLYPRPAVVGGFYQPAASGVNQWGFASYSPVLFYGKDPRVGKGQDAIMTTLTDKPYCTKHPCSKPLEASKWLVKKGSLEGETVFDPFMGTASIGVAAVTMQRRYIGIEIDPKYFEIACKNLETAQSQMSMFDLPTPTANKPKVKVQTLLGEMEVKQK